MSQRKGFRAFFRESSASETLKSAIAGHTILGRNLPKAPPLLPVWGYFFNSDHSSPPFIALTKLHSPWKALKKALKVWGKNVFWSQSEKKQAARSCFVLTSSGAFQFFFTATTNEEAQWPIGYSVGLRIKRSSVRIRPWPLRWVLGQGSLLPLSQGEAFTLASISYLAILVKYILAKKKKTATTAIFSSSAIIFPVIYGF